MILLFLENFFISLSAVFANKTRSILTALGIIIGVVSVTMMGTLISGLDKTFESSMSWLGKDILYVSRYEWFGDMEWWEVRNRPRIRPEYVDKVKERSKYALAVAPVMQRGADLSRGEKKTRTEIFGTNEDYMETITTNIVKGRFFSKNEDRSGARVTVIGNGIKEAFFGDQDPIGKYIKIDNIKFRVIGVLEKQGKFLGLFSVDKQAILPIGAYNRIFSKRGWMRLSIKIPENKIEEGLDEISSVMRHIRGLKPNQKNDFAINQTKAFEKNYNTLKLAIGGTGTFITLLSLIVGGIGVMNIMFVSVKERTREIGVRKAIGATRGMILGQFLMEAVSICLIAGLIGLSISYILSILLNKIFPSTLDIGLAIFSIFMSIVVGVISGAIPSYRAANLDPIDSLRYE
ncbi:MAG: FtsX-like permease family protein [Candidatus Pelagibacter sp. TMED253]|nr:MAG: FtsX-like permease family protein [Candidatus Pelagibacter sp. TMED253]|tara:strand:+ start:1965 stop:3176 length:1212 start_codon:yes stop_codon:yes gene_type:complete